MPRASTAQNVFEGELSPLALGRTDIDQYGRAMRLMANAVSCRTGPAIGRSGTLYECTALTPIDTDGLTPFYSKLLPFVFNEVETLVMEFSHNKLTFHYEFQGVQAWREADASVVVSKNATQVVIRLPSHDVLVGETVVFQGFDGSTQAEGKMGLVSNVSTTDVTVETREFTYQGPTGALAGSEKLAVVYAVATPYHRDDLSNLRHVQHLNTVYLFCEGYKPRILQRYDTFDWRISELVLQDGPYLDVNVTDTYLSPTGNGTWMIDLTSNAGPAPAAAAASSEIAGHEAWRAFDNDIDTYWEANESQSATLEYNFNTGFVNALPNFTAATTGGMTIATSSETTGKEGWRAGDRNADTEWRSASATVLPQTWQIDTGAANTMYAYTIRGSKEREEYSPRDWVVYGSAAAGGPFTVVDTRTGMTWESGQQRHFNTQSPAAFRYYMIQVAAVNPKIVVVVDQWASDEKPGGEKKLKCPKNQRKGGKYYTKRVSHTEYTAQRAAMAKVEMSFSAGQPRVVTGYTIYLGRYAKGKRIRNHAPKTWYFQAYDGNNWVTLDSQQSYKDWADYRSQFFPLQNARAFKKYRLNIKECVKSGDVNPRVGKLVLASADAPPLSVSASSTININDGRGFLSTDVNRLIRLKDGDNVWRWGTIAAVNSSFSVTLTIPGVDPLVLDKRVQSWRLGLWSDTTGWPICGTVHEDRLWMAGSNGYPDHVVGSRMGQFTSFIQVSPKDIVLDTHAIVTRANSQFMSKILWLKSAEGALLAGTGIQEFILTTPVDQALTARNAKIRPTTNRGSLQHEPAKVGNHVLMLSQTGRTLYDYSWDAGSEISAGSYKSNTLSALGQHLLEPRVEQVAYQQEPHSVLWGRREDGSMVAMTYDAEFGRYGGHRHDFGGVVEDICVCPSPTDRQDNLWMVIKRTVNGRDVRYIERLFRFWDFGDLLDADATFVDSALRYYGTVATAAVDGLYHLEGELVDVLADNIVYRDVGPVTNGRLTLLLPATYVVVGKRFVTEGEIVTPEAGAADGTAMGKSKRPHSVVLSLWDSASGEVGRINEDSGAVEYTPVEYDEVLTPSLEPITLKTAYTKATVLPMGHGKLGTVRFKQADPLPFNVVAVYPQSNVTDDR